MSVLLMHDTLSAAQVTLLRSFVAMVLTGLVLLCIDRSAFKISKGQLGLVAILGIAGVAMLNQFYALAVATIDVGIALLFEYLAVPAVAVIALLFFQEKVRARIWVSIGLVVVGLAFVAQVWNSSLNPLGVFYASMAACAYVIYFLLGERALKSMKVMGMIFWALLLVVTVKYVAFVLRADNNGEGGVLSLMALALRSARSEKRIYMVLLML
jgi:drug/metabolite transporter (DMT)-like permease